ncbi:MAG: PhnD/SsuA/transferrin family substrate-binding protein [Gammaproteobacteria bacterium]|nr:PhnD/SsuA/transferrin family substrate-binding protein [Gammaproteobacteria bacterium]
MTIPEQENAACAVLGMYDWPELTAVTNELWQHLAVPLSEAGLAAPTTLERERPLLETWLDPELVLGQTCGFPYLAHLQDSTTLLGTPDYAVDGAEQGYYQSLLISHKDNEHVGPLHFPGSVLAVNGVNSQSGFNAIRLYLAELSREGSIETRSDNTSPPFRSILHTGSHRASLQAVARKQADLCAVDPVSFALARDFDADVLKDLQVTGRTPSVPALPLICSNRNAERVELDSLRKSLRQCFDRLPATVRKPLHLRGLHFLDDSVYQLLREQTRTAIDMGFDSLAQNQEDAPAV